MRDKKLTPWFPAGVTPAHSGVYQVRISGWVKYSRWGEGRWHLALTSFAQARASRIRSTDCYMTDRFGGWRGLAEQPK